MTAGDVIRAMQHLLASPDAVSKVYHARDAAGFMVTPHSVSATRWDLEGASRKITGTDQALHQKVGGVLRRTALRLDYPLPAMPEYRNPWPTLATFSDSATHGEWMALLDAALEGAIVTGPDGALTTMEVLADETI